MEDIAMFAVGDRVRVKELGELRKELGENIKTPCEFVNEMHRYCGRTMEVIRVSSYKGSFYYNLKGGDYWNFDECVLDYAMTEKLQIDPNSISMSYESLF